MAQVPAYVREIEEAIEVTRTFVEQFGGRIRGLGKELQTRYWLIDPMLKALGWDVNDPDKVWVQYPVPAPQGRTLYPDYAFFAPNTDVPVVILEAKAISDADIASVEEEWDEDDDQDEEETWEENGEEWDDDEEWDNEEQDAGDYIGQFREGEVDQLRRQCRGLRNGYGVLSKGSLWSIYDLGEPGNPRTAAGFQRKRIAHFNLLSSPSEMCIAGLRLLHRRNFR